MPLWTDLIDPETLSDYAQRTLADYEASKGTLAQYLPNRDVADIVVRFFKGQTGLVDVARFRAYDAEPEIGRRPSARRVTLELPALGLNMPVSEYEQLRQRSPNVSDDAALQTILNATDAVVRSVADAVELLRGIVLATGRATVDQDNFQIDDDFGRPDEHQLTAATLWTTTTVSRLDYLREIVEQYEDTTGETPGSILTGRRVMRALSAGDEFQTQLLNGEARIPSDREVREIVAGADLPPITVFDRRVSTYDQTEGKSVMRRVLPDDLILLLPEPVGTTDYAATDLGATFWGRTLTSTSSDWAIPDAAQPGLVAGVWRNEKVPMGVEIMSDAIAMPVLANAEKSLAAKVL